MTADHEGDIGEGDNNASSPSPPTMLVSNDTVVIRCFLEDADVLSTDEALISV